MAEVTHLRLACTCAQGGSSHHHHHHKHLHTSVQALTAGIASPQPHQRELRHGSGKDASIASSSNARLVAERPRVHNDEWLNWWAFAKPQPSWNASDAHGPGVQWGMA